MKHFIVLFFVIALLARDHLSMTKPLAKGDSGTVARQLKGGFLGDEVVTQGNLLESEEERNLKEINITINLDLDGGCGCPEEDCEHQDDDADDDDDDLDDFDDGNQAQEDEDDDDDDDLDDFDDGNQAQEDEDPLDTDDDGFTDLDWVWRGAVIAPIDQGNCNADFAFAITTAMESRHWVDHGLLYNFSEQYLLDCFGDADVCTDGRDMATSLSSLQDPANAVPRNWNYEYEGVQGDCEDHTKYAYISSWTSIDGSDTANIFAALENSALIARVQDSDVFNSNTDGVITDCGLGDAAAENWVNIVGYHVVDGQLAWRVKNSQGPFFGDGGYAWLLVTEGPSGTCGINQEIYEVEGILLV